MAYRLVRDERWRLAELVEPRIFLLTGPPENPIAGEFLPAGA